MPRLPNDVAQEAAGAASGFEPFPPGIYPARLESVIAFEPKKSNGHPYWRWEYQIMDYVGAPAAGRRVWNNTSMDPKSRWALKEAFEAFRAQTSDDTDELLGSICLVQVEIRTIESGPRAGEEANSVRKTLPYSAEQDAWGQGGRELNPGYSYADEEPF